VIGFLRFLGVANAAVWFGAAIFFTLGVGPGIFSHDIEKLFGEAVFRYYAGGVALVLIQRYFALQYICGTIALLHMFGEWLYLGRKAKRFTLWLIVTLFALGLVGGVGLQPKMKALRQTMYGSATPEQKERATHSFNTLHGVSQTANLFIIIGLAVYLMRVSRPPDTRPYSTNFTKFRG